MIAKTNNLKDFCTSARFSNQLEAMDLVCKEAQRIKIENKKRTGFMKIKDGDQDKAYYEDLKVLMVILTNTSLPQDLRPDFLQDIHPLVIRLYRTNVLMGKILREIERDKLIADTFKFSGEDITLAEDNVGIDFLTLISSREDVEKQSTRGILNSLDLLLKPSIARKYFERVDIGISGYENDYRELCEIKEVRHWVSLLDNRFPYWFFFLSKLHTGLMFIGFSLCNYQKKPNGSLYLANDSTTELFFRKHFAAMNEICDQVHLPDSEVESLTRRVMLYFDG